MSNRKSKREQNKFYVQFCGEGKYPLISLFKDCQTASNCDATDAPTPKPTNAPTPAPTPEPDNNGGNKPWCVAGEPCPSYFEDFNNLDGWDIQHVPNSYNNEYQFYTNRWKNVRTEDGYLKLRPFRPVFSTI